MSETGPVREERSVRVDTIDGAIAGDLHISSRLRTLDDLNMVSKRFITLHSSKSVSGDWHPSAGPLAINKDSILFVRELSAPPPKSAGNFGSFTRAPIRLRIKGFEIEGFVHVPPDGMAMKRFDQDTHSFISLTTALVTGPGTEEMTPFLAVNRDYVTAAQVVDLEEGAAVTSSVDTQIER